MYMVIQEVDGNAQRLYKMVQYLFYTTQHNKTDKIIQRVKYFTDLQTQRRVLAHRVARDPPLMCHVTAAALFDWPPDEHGTPPALR